MKVLIVGAGGREHALAWKLAQSPRVERIYASPGNGGIGGEEKCENVPLPQDAASPEGQEALLAFCREKGVSLTIVGPEAPLEAGIVDRFRDAGAAIIGPDSRAARLETSKIFAKSFMNSYGVATGRHRVFTEYEKALLYARSHFMRDQGNSSELDSWSQPGHPLVIKADGLAAGKGVVIAKTLAEAEATLHSFMQDASLGEAGQTLLFEEYISGKEVSVLAAVDAKPGQPGTILPFIAARDYKNRFDNDQGPNTGGMGAIAPTPDFTEQIQEDFIDRILKPTLRGIEQESLAYRGFIFFGLMIRENRCYLLEYNARLGDPETQAVLPLMDSDLWDLAQAIWEGSLDSFPLAWKPGSVCAPVAVSRGYPGAYHRGAPISVDSNKFSRTSARIFIAGAECKAPGYPQGVSSGAIPEETLFSTGGRVLAVSAWGADAAEARTNAYTALQCVSFQEMDYRKDIGA